MEVGSISYNPDYRSPVTAPGAVTMDGDDVGPKGATGMPGYYDLSPSRYPPPAEAELVTLWKRSGRVVMSITADGKTQDFYMPPARLVYLLREVADQLAENTPIQ
jgi:hypothetical protein